MKDYTSLRKFTNGWYEFKHGNGFLGTEATVFQSEIMAIQKCAEVLANEEVHEAIIYSDSQAALGALTSLKIQHKSVEKCIKTIKTLNGVAMDMKLTLAWIKAHADHPGNERADCLAKTGTTNTNNLVNIPNPLSTAKVKLRKNTYNLWHKEWKDYKEARQCKIWFPTINCKASEGLLKLG